MRHLSYPLISFKKPSRKNSGLCLRKKRQTACLASALLPKRLQVRFFFKDETDKSHLVRDPHCMVDGVDAPNQELQYGFALPSPSVVSHCHPTRERQI
ncbi:hypothetical protein TNCV_2927571 [Trichonephila clavipes]|nr:hypothetical protein TNCV_2927571 [Trichonephila clavipes]